MIYIQYIFKYHPKIFRIFCWILQLKIVDIPVGLDLSLVNYLYTQSLYFASDVTPKNKVQI